MAKDTYKKRAKGSWHVGKGCKGDSEERQFSKREIAQELKEDQEEFLHRHKAKRKRNKLAQLEYSIQWYAQRIDFWTKHNPRFASTLRADLERKQKQLAELKRKGQVS